MKKKVAKLRRNVMTFDGGFGAVISYEPQLDFFRGEFVGLDGVVEFYARDSASLRAEGQKSLDVYLAMCREDKASPFRPKGKVPISMDGELYHQAKVRAAAGGSTLNQWIVQAVRRAVKEQPLARL
jgi:predicted HicB family RNase H-like nuclease